MNQRSKNVLFDQNIKSMKLLSLGEIRSFLILKKKEEIIRFDFVIEIYFSLYIINYKHLVSFSLEVIFLDLLYQNVCRSLRIKK